MTKEIQTKEKERGRHIRQLFSNDFVLLETSMISLFYKID